MCIRDSARTPANTVRDGRQRRIGGARMALWAMSAAAAVALLVVMGYHVNENTIHRLADNSSAGVRRQDNGLTATADGDAVVYEANPLLACGSGSSVVACGDRLADAALATDCTAMSEDTPVADSASCLSGTGSDTGSVGGGARSVVAGKNVHKEPLPPMGYIAENPSRRGSDARFTVGLHTGGVMADNRSSDYPAQRAMESPLMNVALLARYKESKHHAQPLSVGVSVGYSLGERVSLTSGVVYTRAVTDFIKSSGADDVVETQRLHYIGVPLAVRYRVWGNRHVQTYATAGGEADFNVATTLKAGDVKLDADRDRVQFSVNAAAGVQLNVVPQVGVYVEPGVKYYFDNKSQVETIFKDKPWAFNLNVGLRVEL